MTMGKLKKAISELKEIASEKNAKTLSVAFDYLSARRANLCSVKEYRLYGMYKKPISEIKDEYTEGKRKRLEKALEKSGELKKFYDKKTFFAMFGELTKRAVFSPDGDEKALRGFLDSVETFVKKKEYGKIEPPLDVAEPSDAELVGKYLEYLKNGGIFLEEYIIQHGTLCSVGGSSVATADIMTEYGDTPKIILGTLTLGNGYDTDNCDFIKVPLDTEKMKTCGKGIDRNLAEAEVHPKTKVYLEGIPLPYGEDIKELAIEAAKTVPNVKYVLWRIAVTVSGPVLISADPCPDLNAERVLYGNRLPVKI